LPPVATSPTSIINPSRNPVASIIPSASRTPSSDQSCKPEIEDCTAIPPFFVPPTAPSGAEIITTSPPEPLIASSDTSDVVSAIIDVSLADPSAVLGGDVELCFFVPPAARNKDLCLGFLDESLQPPEWTCEDKCVEEGENGFACGSTDHFTNFALLLEGAANGGGSDGCSSISEDWVTNSWIGDLILLLSCAAVVALICVVIILSSLTSPIKRLIYGAEGYRITNARTAATRVVTD